MKSASGINTKGRKNGEIFAVWGGGHFIGGYMVQGVVSGANDGRQGPRDPSLHFVELFISREGVDGEPEPPHCPDGENFKPLVS